MAEEKPEKFQITFVDLVMLERAAQLKVIDEFERRFVANLSTRFSEYGMEMRITHKQRTTLKKLSERFKTVFEWQK